MDSDDKTKTNDEEGLSLNTKRLHEVYTMGRTDGKAEVLDKIIERIVEIKLK